MAGDLLAKSSHWPGVPIGCSKIQIIKMLEFPFYRSDGIDDISMDEEPLSLPLKHHLSLLWSPKSKVAGKGTVGEEGEWL